MVKVSFATLGACGITLLYSICYGRRGDKVGRVRDRWRCCFDRVPDADFGCRLEIFKSSVDMRLRLFATGVR